MKRSGKKRAIVAITRMILTAIYLMLSTGEAWNPSDLYKINMPEALLEKQKAKAIKFPTVPSAFSLSSGTLTRL